MSADQLLRLGAVQSLDADRAAERDHGGVEAIAPQELEPARGSLLVGVDHVGRLAGAVQNGHAVLSAHERELAPGRERVEERFGPDVLMNVEEHGRRPKTSNSIKLSGLGVSHWELIPMPDLK